MVRQETPYVNRFCLFLLFAEWLIFGSCHFLFLEATEAQIPDFFPFKTFIAVITGVIEIAAAILILIPGTRKWAAVISLVLLVLFLPAIFNMLFNDSAIPGTDAWRNAVRVTLVPNHVVLALAAIRLLRYPNSRD